MSPLEIALFCGQRVARKIGLSWSILIVIFGVYALYLHIGDIILKKPSSLIPESEREKCT
jgi:hypothetical protein